MAEYSPIVVGDNFFRGRRSVDAFTVLDAAGSLQIMTGWVVGYRMTHGQHSTITPLIDWKSDGSGSANIQISNPGTVLVTLPGSVTANFEGSDFPNYWRELRRVEDAGGNDTLLAFGEVVLRES